MTSRRRVRRGLNSPAHDQRERVWRFSKIMTAPPPARALQYSNTYVQPRKSYRVQVSVQGASGGMEHVASED